RRRTARAIVLTVVLTGAAPATSVAGVVTHGAIAAVNANQSNNWGGYNQGAVQKGTIFTSISGVWVVPTATQHVSGKAESSSSWIGIGGGCPESTCTAPSATLIQEGTEQDVSKGGTASYY